MSAIHRAGTILLIAAPLALGVPGCHPIATPMGRVLQEVVLEEAALDRTCAVLTARETALTQLTPKVDSAATAAVREHDVTAVGAVLSALGVDQHCRAGDFVKKNISTTCEKEIKTQLNNLDTKGSADIPKSRQQARFAEALRYSGYADFEALVKDPVELAKNIDLSTPLLLAFITVADLAEQAASDLAASLPFGSGAARIALRQLAAEAMAVLTEEVAKGLEAKARISAASLSRAACARYQNIRGGVAARLLRRTILRFDASKSPYPLQELCRDNDQCADILAKAKLSPVLLTPAPPTRLTVASAGGAQVRRDDDSHAGRHADQQSKEPTEDQIRAGTAQRLLQATEYCTVAVPTSSNGPSVTTTSAPVPCSLRVLGNIAGVLAVNGVDGSHAVTDADMVAMRESLQRIKDAFVRLENAQADIARNVEEMRDESRKRADILATRLSQMEERVRLIGAGVDQLTACGEEMNRVRETRRALLAALGLPKNEDPCTLPNSELEWTKDSLKLSVKRYELCDVAQDSMPILVRTAGSLFERCSPRLAVEPGKTLSALLQTVLMSTAPAVTELRIIGHADIRPVMEGCMRGVNNQTLSLERANAAKDAIPDGAKHRKNIVETAGAGDAAPIKPCELSSAEECHAVNRRVELVLSFANGFDRSKCDALVPSSAEGAKGKHLPDKPPTRRP